MGDTAGGAGGVFSGGVAGRFFSSSLTARGRLAGASLSFSDVLGGASSLCRGDERGRLLRVLSKSIFGLRGLKVLYFAGAGLFRTRLELELLGRRAALFKMLLCVWLGLAPWVDENIVKKFGGDEKEE